MPAVPALVAAFMPALVPALVPAVGAADRVAAVVGAGPVRCAGSRRSTSGVAGRY
jgi:hypothetical protein